jgi:hypothetical protein
MRILWRRAEGRRHYCEATGWSGLIPGLLVGLVLAAPLAWAAPAAAQLPGLPPLPISQDPLPPQDLPQFVGGPATPQPVSGPTIPQHPFMAANGTSNIHDDAYMTDTYAWSGPLGRDVQVSSAFFARECGSVTIDSAGRLETICVGLDRPVLTLLDPVTLEVLASYELPPRNPSPNPFRDFTGGGYFYLDEQDQAVAPTSNRHIFVVAQTDGPDFELVRDYDLSAVVASGDGIISVLPDWDGRLWFASNKGVVGFVDPATGAIESRQLGEGITNSFAVDDRGGVFIVTDRALYRFDARGGGIDETWREVYENSGVAKPGQSDAGSGTTPTVIGRNYVAITDNADPMQVVVYQRKALLQQAKKRKRKGKRPLKRLICAQEVFAQGAGSTDQSLIAAGRKMVVENNYGYTGPASTMQGVTTEPGLERVDMRKRGRGCKTVWHSDERAPSVVPKLSLANGLVYTYTKPQLEDATDAWYFTAIDFHTGETVYSRLAGTGLGFNNNFAPVTLAPDGTAYVGMLGGIARFADGG